MRTVLHVDDDAVVGDWVRNFVDGMPGYCHLGVARNGRRAISLTERLQPDIVLLEMSMPDMDGFSVAEQLTRISGHARILMFTRRADEAFLHRAAAGPFAGLVWKLPDARYRLRSAFAELSAGRSWFPPEFVHAERRLRGHPEAISKLFSDRELALFPLLGSGQADAQIAQVMNLSPATVHGHRQRIMAKLNLHGVNELMRWLAEKGFVSFSRPAPPCLEESD